MEQLAPGLSEIEREFQRFPASVAQEFRRAALTLSNALASHELQAWATEGLTIAQQTVRSWEAAAEYFRVSPMVLPVLSFSNLLAWARAGEALCQDSPSIAVSYFRAGPGSLSQIRPSNITTWSSLGHNVYNGTWKSSALSCKFFDSSPQLLTVLTFPELERFMAFIGAVAQRSYDLAQESMDLGLQVFPLMGENRDSFIAMMNAVTAGSWRAVRGAFAATVVALPRIDRSQRARFISMAERLARTDHHAIPSFLEEGSRSLAQIDSNVHLLILNMADALLQSHPPAVHEFLRSSPNILARITPQQMEVWFTEGARLLRENREAGTAFFRAESVRSGELLKALSSAVELATVKELMQMYCRALAGADMEVAPVQDLARKGIGWVSRERPTTEGTTIYLQPTVDRYESKEENFGLLKVVSTHQVAHLEFGSFEFEFERPSGIFQDLRPRLAAIVPPKDAVPELEELGIDPSSAETSWVTTNMHRFFSLFQDRKLALDIFTVVEDGRLDSHVQREYAGIRPHYRRVQQDSLSERPVMEELPARQAIVEFLVRLSLQRSGDVSVPKDYIEEARAVARISRRVMVPASTVEDAAEASVRIYSIIAKIPNEEIPPEDYEQMDVNDLGEQEEGEQDQQDIIDFFEKEAADAAEADDAEQEGEEGESYESPAEVDYRGEFKPEMVQLLAALRDSADSGDDSQMVPLTQEMLEALLNQSPELQMDMSEEEVAQSASTFANNMMKEAGVTAPPPNATFGQGPLVHVDDEDGPLEATEPNTHVYDEWDFRADDYRSRWCMVRERPMSEGDINFWYQTLQQDAGLVSQIRRQFELAVPESMRKIRPLTDGEDYDFDATIEFILDVRSGSVPSDKIYWRRNKIERDVAVVFLLDMSASTAEAIDEARRTTDDWDAPSDPVEYMLWLRTRRGEGARRTPKRIIDLEKESVVLIVQALEALGDQYGIYGFSGYGRENVEFYSIKDIQENLTDAVRRRVDKIAPLHATRMGPAIRHCTTKLANVAAKTKILFLISDGRPQDRGYSREGVEKEYAVHDTHMALVEARSHEITPFALTVDKAGHDYLKTMCGDMGYEVLFEIQALPQRIPELYKRLTV